MSTTTDTFDPAAIAMDDPAILAVSLTAEQLRQVVEYLEQRLAAERAECLEAWAPTGLPN